MPQLRLERGAPAGTREKSPLSLPREVDSRERVGPPAGKLKPGPGRSATDVASHQRARIHGALVEIVFEQGYRAVTVRALARAAGVSTRSFYQHYASKEQCFLGVQQEVGRRLLENLESSSASTGGQHQRIELVVDALVKEWDRDPKAARLLLIDAYAAGPNALEQAQQINHAIEAHLGESFRRTPVAMAISSLVIDGVVAGLTSVARNCLLSDPPQPIAVLGDTLIDWVLTYINGPTGELEELDCLPGFPRSNVRELRLVPSPDSELTLILAAASKLSAGPEQDALTPSGIAAAAGVSRRSFQANFSCLEDCLSMALELHINRAMACARQESRRGLTPTGEIYCALSALLDRIAHDPTLAYLCFGGLMVEEWRFRRQGQLAIEIGRLIAEKEPRTNTESLKANASIAAFLGALQTEIAGGRIRRLSQNTPVLTYLLLAPMAGAMATVESMRREHMRGSEPESLKVNYQGGEANNYEKKLQA